MCRVPCGKRKTTWYGERKAMQVWVEFLAEKLVECGAVRGRADPTKFIVPDLGVCLESHVDDGHLTGPDTGLLQLYDRLVQAGVKLKPAVINRVGDSYSYLRRVYSRTRQGMLIEPSPSYVEMTLTELQLQECKAASTPEPPGDRNILPDSTGSELCDADEGVIYRRCTMRLLYFSQDRFELGHAVRRLSKKLKEPTKEDFARLKRLGRYLSAKRRVGYLLPEMDDGWDNLEGYTDSDWAQDQETRKSISCGVMMLGDCFQGGYVRGQDVLATSSGMAEFFGIGSMVNESIGVRQVYMELGVDLTATILTYSSAALGMCHRRGVGRIRHMDIRFLHVQDCLRDGRISSVAKVPGADNVADIGTKVLTKDRITYLMDRMHFMELGVQGEFESVGLVSAGSTDSVDRLRDLFIQVFLESTAHRGASRGTK